VSTTWSGGERAVKVRIDQELCTGDGQCVEICPDVFVMNEAGCTYVAQVKQADVVPSLEAAVVEAAEDCPGACIFVDP
jgi:ferredoxin